MEKNNDKNSEKIRKVLFNEVTAAIAFISIVIGVVNWISSPVNQNYIDILEVKQEVSLIKNNHLVHIQDSLDRQEEKNEKIDDFMMEANVKIERILTILEQ